MLIDFLLSLPAWLLVYGAFAIVFIIVFALACWNAEDAPEGWDER